MPSSHSTQSSAELCAAAPGSPAAAEPEYPSPSAAAPSLTPCSSRSAAPRRAMSATLSTYLRGERGERVSALHLRDARRSSRDAPLERERRVHDRPAVRPRGRERAAEAVERVVRAARVRGRVRTDRGRERHRIGPRAAQRAQERRVHELRDLREREDGTLRRVASRERVRARKNVDAPHLRRLADRGRYGAERVDHVALRADRRAPVVGRAPRVGEHVERGGGAAQRRGARRLREVRDVGVEPVRRRRARERARRPPRRGRRLRENKRRAREGRAAQRR